MILHPHASAMHIILDMNILDSFLSLISVTVEDFTLGVVGITDYRLLGSRTKIWSLAQWHDAIRRQAEARLMMAVPILFYYICHPICREARRYRTPWTPSQLRYSITLPLLTASPSAEVIDPLRTARKTVFV
jgi:hypothetical protein